MHAPGTFSSTKRCGGETVCLTPHYAHLYPEEAGLALIVIHWKPETNEPVYRFSRDKIQTSKYSISLFLDIISIFKLKVTFDSMIWWWNWCARSVVKRGRTWCFWQMGCLRSSPIDLSSEIGSIEVQPLLNWTRLILDLERVLRRWCIDFSITNHDHSFQCEQFFAKNLCGVIV